SSGMAPVSGIRSRSQADQGEVRDCARPELVEHRPRVAIGWPPSTRRLHAFQTLPLARHGPRGAPGLPSRYRTPAAPRRRAPTSGAVMDRDPHEEGSQLAREWRAAREALLELASKLPETR